MKESNPKLRETFIYKGHEAKIFIQEDISYLDWWGGGIEGRVLLKSDLLNCTSTYGNLDSSWEDNVYHFLINLYKQYFKDAVEKQSEGVAK